MNNGLKISLVILVIGIFLLCTGAKGCLWWRDKDDDDSGSSGQSPYDIIHTGDLVITGTNTMVIEDLKYLQRGNIYINDEAKLIVKKSQLVLGRGDVPTIHVYIFVDAHASLQVENSQWFRGQSRPLGRLDFGGF